MYLTYTICSEYHSTSEVAYCVPYLHNMIPLSRYYQVAYCVPNLHNMSHYHNTTEVAYCVDEVHNMVHWWYNNNGTIVCRMLLGSIKKGTQYLLLM